MGKLIFVEIYKTFAKPRTYIGIIAVIGIIGLIQLGYFVSKDDIGKGLQNRMGETISVENITINGNYIYYFVLNLLFIHLPIIIALVSGDSVSGEMSSGTIRSLLTKPIPRYKIFFAKFFANQIYVVVVTLVIFIFGFVLSILIFGNGDLVVYTDGISILEQDDLPKRIAMSLLLAFISLSVISTLSFMLSCFMDNSVAPIVTTIVVVIVFTIVGSLDFELFKPIQDFLFTTHTKLWDYCFYFQPAYNEIGRSLMILTVYMTLFLSVGLIHFTRKDITQ
jgi:ABC-2 type transport system permease protein